jgi:tRNA pseudouridine55 synthase
MNRLFVVRKPIFRSSNGYMNHLKWKYNTKKIGFSGTLDPFATGCLIVATGQYTKLFNYLDKTPKTYRATIWLGTSSPTLDIEQITQIMEIEPFSKEYIEQTLASFVGELTYYPPQFCAKKVDGVASYKNARNGKNTVLKSITSTIYKISLLNYNHPFVHFEATVSEGTYIRSLGKLIANKLGTDGALSSLERLKEGRFEFEHEKALDPLDFISIARNEYLGDIEDVELGKKLLLSNFSNQRDGIYLVITPNFFSIIEIQDQEINYRINRMPLFKGDINV